MKTNSMRHAIWGGIAGCAVLLAGSPLHASAQRNPGDEPDMTIDPAMRAQVLNGALAKLNSGYVFPEVAGQIEAAIKKRVANHEYDSVTSARELAKLLTEHLQAVSHDKHMRVFYNSERITESLLSKEPTPKERDEMDRQLRQINYGFEKVERLTGNIGYLDLRGFMPADAAAQTANAAMTFLANTDALILDLRKNGGGDPAMVQVLCSYLFGPEPVHLNDLYFREGNETRQFWTLPSLPGPRFLDKPVYVLTSHRTFSGAEECTYNLKTQKRATIVGETTGGGANPGDRERISEHFSIFVPGGRAINPITHTNWEGTGVSPDVSVTADAALPKARVLALETLIGKETDGKRKRDLTEALAAAEKELELAGKGGTRA